MRNQPSLRVITLICIGVILVGGGATHAMHSASREAKDRYLKLLNEVPDESVLRRQVDSSQAKVDETKSRLKHLEESVPSMAYVPTLLTELEKLGKEHHIAVTGVRPVLNDKAAAKTDDKKSGQKKAGYQEIAIDITGRGTYANVISMVDGLKKFPKIVAVQTVGLMPRRETGVVTDNPEPQQVGRVLEATVRIRAYLFPLPSNPDSASNGASS